MSNRADRRRMMREQTAKGQQLLASYTKQQRIDALMQQGISPQQLKANYDLGFKNGYHDGYCCGTLTMRKTIYAAMSLALHELHGFGEERLIKVLKLVDEKLYYCLDCQDLVDELFAKTGLELELSETIDELKGVEADG